MQHTENPDALRGAPPDGVITNDPWKDKIVLALDGGGTRGYASLLMLRYLMRCVQNIEQQREERHDSSFDPRDAAPNGHIIGPGQEQSTAVESDPDQISRRPRTTSSLNDRENARTDTFGARSAPGKRFEPAPNLQGFLPCHYFDYIVGTSTGGLNAIMLGRLRMTVDECIEIYPQIAQEIFGRSRVYLKGLWRSKYDSAWLENAVKALVNKRIQPKNGRPYDRYPAPEDLCRTIVVSKKIAAEETAESPYIFRTYPHELHQQQSPILTTEGYQPSNINDWLKNPGPANDHEIWEVGRATSAAPRYFKPMLLDNVKYSDGGVSLNNPAEIARTEILLKEGALDSSTRTQPLSLVLSIGTGKKPTKKEKAKRKLVNFMNEKHIRKGANLASRILHTVTDVDEVETRMQQYATENGYQHYRWTGGEKVGGLDLDEWEQPRKRKFRDPEKEKSRGTQKNMEEWVAEYMRDQKVQSDLERIAKFLVDHRRRRIHCDHDKWKRYTYCTRIPCTYCNDKELWTRACAKEHIRSLHPEELHHFTNLDNYVASLPEIYPKCERGPW